MSEDDNKTPQRDVAIALEYETGSREAPKVVAKGYGEVAKKIVALANENDVVVESNPHLAEALSGVELDDTIPIELYQAVAEVIGFVMKANKKLS